MKTLKYHPFADESAMDVLVWKSLKEQGFAAYRQAQIGSGGFADVLAKSPDGEIWVVENKLRDWRKVIEQAHRHVKYHSVHRSFICLPDGEWPAEMYERAEQAGVGVMLAGDTVRIVREAPLVEPWDILMRNTLQMIEFLEPLEQNERGFSLP